ncbi:MAG: PAS domain-containing sensor histidine kinase [Desulfobacteraceae bacterium 4572_130]|nr:MAG: PAS domain-containing sensor histidine kinase [Desulfobacteraceae bacterium 4572_130]
MLKKIKKINPFQFKVTGIKKDSFYVLAILIAVGFLTFLETRITSLKLNFLGTNFPILNAVLMFILINTNLLLLLALILFVFRNFAKLYYEKKSRILGSKLKTRLVGAFVILSIVPTSVLFFFSIQFISTSIGFWFNAPVEQALNNSLTVGRELYEYIEDTNLFFAKRAASQIHSRKLLNPEKNKELTRYIEVVQRAFNLHAVEVYTPGAKRFTLSLARELNNSYFGILASDDFIKIPEHKNIKTICKIIQAGESIRTIATIPFGSKPGKAQAFLVITVLIPHDLSLNLASISKGFEEYQQLKMIKRPIQISTYIALFIVALLVLFCAVWFGFYLAQTITIPITKFAEGTKKVSDGDLNYKIDFKADDEIGTLIDSFNSMTQKLATGRKELDLSEKILKQQNQEIEKSRQYMEIILRNISAGVISLDQTGIVTTINKAAETMLNIKKKDILNYNYKTMLKKNYLNIPEEINEKIFLASGNDEFPLALTINGTPKHFAVYFNVLKSDVGEIIGSVMVFNDLTELEKAQRMAAWREVAKRIAHEVKNPLTPIKLSAQRLNKKYSRQINEKIFDTCTQAIVKHVDIIRNLVNGFSTFAKFPDKTIVPCRIENIIKEVLLVYKQEREELIIETKCEENIPGLYLDQQQMKQAFINLFDNAVAAVDKNGKILIDISFDQILKIVRIEIADNGKGISDKEKTRLFEPYFSTKQSGMGLGLAIVNSIITDHQGRIRVMDNKPSGAKFIIEFPVTS